MHNNINGNFVFCNGDKVTDTITKFSGTVIARCDYIHDNSSYLVVAETQSGLEEHWFTEFRLTRVE